MAGSLAKVFSLEKGRSVTWEQRWHPLLERWVTITSHRGGRPWQGLSATANDDHRPSFDPQCYLCPGNRRISGERNPQYAQVYVFDNDHPSLGATVAPPPPQSTFYRVAPAAGRCRVMCYGPDHQRRLSHLEIKELEIVLKSWRHETEILSSEGWAHVFIFENNGEVVGVSNPHPHCQIYAFPFVVDTIARELRAAKTYREAHQRPLFQDLIQAERDDQRRILIDNEGWLAFVPYFAQFPFETMICPHRPVRQLTELSDLDIQDLAVVMRAVLGRLDGVLGQAQSYILSVHQAPAALIDPEDYSLYIHIQPLLRAPGLQKFLAGVETAAGQFLNDAAPEAHAQALMEVPLN